MLKGHINGPNRFLFFIKFMIKGERRGEKRSAFENGGLVGLEGVKDETGFVHLGGDERDVRKKKKKRTHQ